MWAEPRRLSRRWRSSSGMTATRMSAPRCGRAASTPSAAARLAHVAMKRMAAGLSASQPACPALTQWTPTTGRGAASRWVRRSQGNSRTPGACPSPGSRSSVQRLGRAASFRVAARSRDSSASRRTRTRLSARTFALGALIQPTRMRLTTSGNARLLGAARRVRRTGATTPWRTGCPRAAPRRTRTAWTPAAALAQACSATRGMTSTPAACAAATQVLRSRTRRPSTGTARRWGCARQAGCRPRGTSGQLWRSTSGSRSVASLPTSRTTTLGRTASIRSAARRGACSATA
mmetsp:Transcript_2374/g.5470  ORF Transcript_2374/g.5470 Transcript_2374/m.5470 type:complete len:290 (+) Transcript_2374:273-1142(+)